MPAPQRDGDTLVFRNAQGTVAVRMLAPEILRVRFSPTQGFGRDHSYAVVKDAFGQPRAEVQIAAQESFIRTAALQVTLRHAPFRVSIADAAGESLDEDDPERGIGFAGRQLKVWKRLRADEHVYGLGEKSGRLDKRGSQLGGSSYAMWTTDAYGYGDDSDPLYLSVPFFMVLRNGRAHGIFLDNTHRSFFDLGHESEELLAFGAEGGELDYYFIHGPHAEAGGGALHGADRAHAAAAALVARLSPVPLQLLPGSQGPLHRRQLPRAPDPRGRDLARHPPPGRLQAPHLGPRALPGPGAHARGPAPAGLPRGVDRRSASEEAARLAMSTTPAWPATTS